MLRLIFCRLRLALHMSLPGHFTAKSVSRGFSSLLILADQATPGLWITASRVSCLHEDFLVLWGGDSSERASLACSRQSVLSSHEGEGKFTATTQEWHWWKSHKEKGGPIPQFCLVYQGRSPSSESPRFCLYFQHKVSQYFNICGHRTKYLGKVKSALISNL